MKLKINESKTFEFNMDTIGCSWEDLKGYFRLTLENVEYGFPVEIKNGVVEVNIPVFKDVLHEDVRSSLYKHKEITAKAKLDLVANNEVYIQAWSGDVDIEIPVSIKLIENTNSVKDAKVSVVDPDVKKYIEEEKQDKKSKLMDALVKLDLSESVDEKNDKIEEKQDDIDTDKEEINKKSKFSKILV